MPLLKSSMLCALEYSPATDASEDTELIEAAEGTSSKSYCDVDGCGAVVTALLFPTYDFPYKPAYDSDHKCLTWYSIYPCTSELLIFQLWFLLIGKNFRNTQNQEKVYNTLEKPYCSIVTVSKDICYKLISFLRCIAIYM